ncbi:ABC transporter permease [Lysinibacillus sp. FSL K6-3209]|uniref:ABC transporter permease n=1 Tax=Lysinibacillus sp. FSL K6-3209 TaxID=2921497 RepID=UPI0030DC7162
MNNYIKSDFFRLHKKKLSYVITLFFAVLIVALAVVLEYFAQTEAGFPYGNSRFYYSNVFGMSGLSLLIICFLATYLLWKDRLIIPTSISLGIDRRTIFIGKFIVTFIHFLIVVLILGSATYLAGEFILTDKNDTVTLNFLISLSNLLPLLISALALCYSATFIFNNEITAIIIVFLFYRGLALLIFGLTSVNENISFIREYIPASAMDQLLTDFMNGTVEINIISWIINILIALVVLFVGLKVVEKKDFT